MVVIVGDARSGKSHLSGWSAQACLRAGLTVARVRFDKDEPVDWLLCDVICTPDKTIELCDQWMAADLCRSVVATLKFKGSADYPAIAAARTRLGRHGWPFLRIKHLRNHHNEAVILATRAG